MEDRQFELYKIAVEEYHFQVRYNWDRNKFYILLDISLTGIAAGLVKIPGKQNSELFMIPLFIAGIIISIIGFLTLRKGHEYYRRTVLKMAQLESLSKLSEEEQPIATTAGMRDAKIILGDSKSFVERPFRLGTTTYFLAVLFIFFIAANFSGIMIIVFSRYSL